VEIVKGTLVISLLLLSGCTYEAQLEEEYLNKQYDCIDNRDNSVFSYNTDNVFNIQIGYLGTNSFDLVDDYGIMHHLEESEFGYIACTEDMGV